MKKPLKQGLQQYLALKRLSSKQFTQLNILQEKQQKKTIKPEYSWVKTTVLASAFILFVTVFAFNSAYFSTQRIEQRIAEEVAANHLNLKPLEVSTSKIIKIKSYFKQLDFLPISPAFLKLSKQSLMGGRYCSIQGITAVQLRLVNNETGKIQSLYEADYDKNVFKNFSNLADNNNPQTVYAKGMKVHMWVEKDILFVLTE